MVILVTGAAGFIGSHLAEKLAMNHRVIGLDCLTSFYPRTLKEANVATLRQRNIPVLQLDLAADYLETAVREVEVVYHLAAQPGIQAGATFASYVRDNLIATHRLLEALQQTATLRAFINVATSSIYGVDATGSEEATPQPISYYGVTKLAAEQLVLAAQRDRSLPACSFRLFSVYGPRERPDKLFPRLIRAMLSDQPFPLYLGSEHHLRSYTYIEDIVNGLMRPLSMLERCFGEIFNLGTESAATTRDAIRIVETIVGRSARITRQPRRVGDQTRTHANIAKARRILDYYPTTSLEEGLAKTIVWYREQLRQNE
jgi:UDP-glucuronate 4-epimerase